MVWRSNRVSRRGMLCLLGGALAASAGCTGLLASVPGNGNGGGSTGPKERVRLLIATQTMSAGNANIAAAQELGYFADEGLDVELVFTAGSTDVAKQVAAGGGNDFGFPSPEPIIIGRQPEQGLKLKYFYSILRDQIYSISVPSDSPISSIKELKGKKIGVTSLASAAVPVSKALVKDVGLDPETDVTWVAIGEVAQAAVAVKNKQVDAVAFWDVQYVLVENAGGIKFKALPNDPIANFPSNGLVATEEYLQKYPKRAVGMGRAVAKGTVFATQNPDAAIQLMWKRYPETKPAGQDEATALRNAVQIWQARAPHVSLDRVITKKWGFNEPTGYDALVNFMLAQGLLKSRVNPEDVYTNQFIDEINNFNPEKIKQQAMSWKPK